jgi:hypothetical protein
MLDESQPITVMLKRKSTSSLVTYSKAAKRRATRPHPGVSDDTSSADGEPSSINSATHGSPEDENEADAEDDANAKADAEVDADANAEDGAEAETAKVYTPIEPLVTPNAVTAQRPHAHAKRDVPMENDGSEQQEDVDDSKDQTDKGFVEEGTGGYFSIKRIFAERKDKYLVDWADSADGEKYEPTWELKTDVTQPAIDEWLRRKSKKSTIKSS